MTIPTLNTFINSHYKDIISVVPVYKDWTGLASKSWQTIHNVVKAHVVHKNASLQLITTADNANTSELHQESDKADSSNQQQKRQIIDDCDDFHNKWFRRQDDEDTVSSLLLEMNKVIQRIAVKRSTPQCEEGDHVYEVVECGYKINCRPDFNKASYKELGLVKSSTTIVKENPTYIKRRIKKMKVFMNISSAHIFSKTEHDVDKYETAYNYCIVWPYIDAAIYSISNKAFKALPGEINRKAFSTLGSEYKAVGLCFFNNKEILVLETSGPYNNDDTPRRAYDHIKRAFGNSMHLWAGLKLLGEDLPNHIKSYGTVK
ncbi:hypothetical protein BDC45DRAFT_559195 [Circinella umbellata]|nr:hypothetical protein BDC45DRAFT_559195 [Circinella umbellata]